MITNKKALEKELQFTGIMKSLVESNQEISVWRMQNIRHSVEKTREFAAGVSSIVADVRNNYLNKISKVMEEGGLNELISFSTSVKKAGWVSVLITPNMALSGSLVQDVFEQFIQNTDRSFSDIVIIGNLGKKLYEERGVSRPYTYFEIPEHDITMDDLKQVITYLSQYSRVDTYYGKLDSLIKQQALFSEITGNKLLFSAEHRTEENTSAQKKFLFEPEVREIIIFLEAQLLALFFKQTVHESNLAQLGSRINALENATQKIGEELIKLKRSQRVMLRFLESKKQKQLLAGMQLWES